VQVRKRRRFLQCYWGQELYSKEEFQQSGICLGLVKTNNIEYRQDSKKSEFVPYIYDNRCHDE